MSMLIFAEATTRGPSCERRAGREEGGRKVEFDVNKGLVVEPVKFVFVVELVVELERGVQSGATFPCVVISAESLGRFRPTPTVACSLLRSSKPMGMLGL